jgi:hypothetical protein
MSETFTRHAGVKFETDGSVRRFPGNTVICMVDPASDIHRLLVWAHERLAEMHCVDHFALLPEDSFHMTVMEGVCDQVRKPENWPTGIPSSASLDDVRGLFKEAVSRLDTPESFRMRFKAMDFQDVVKLDLVPADEAAGRQLAAYRDTLSEATTLRFGDHDRYVFHISLAYLIRELDSSELNEFQQAVSVIESRMETEFGTWNSGPPALCYFDDMFRFVPELMPS